MRIHINWTFFLDVTTPQKSAKLMKIIAGLLGELEGVKTERYWKDKTLYRVTATSVVGALTPQEAYYAIMQLAAHLARSWLVSIPSEDGLLEFWGATQPGSGQIQGIDSIHFNCLQDVAVNKTEAATA